MRDITEDEIQKAFGEKTFLKGRNYFENDSVVMGVKKGDILTGKVLDSASYPYEVTIKMSTLYAECTCPVKMCNHGVALLLQWIHKRESFVDADRLLGSLREREKEELIKIIKTLLEKEPALASDSVFFEKVEKKIDSKALLKRIRYIGRDFVDYYEVPGVVGELEEVKKVGDNLLQKGIVKMLWKCICC